MIEQTFSLIKPDATVRGLTGAILQKLESEGLKLVKARLLMINKKLSEEFYQEHRDKPFFSSLLKFIQSGPVFAMALEGEDAVACVRKMMGHTDPEKALPGTLRALYGESVERNSIHGSDSLVSAKRELSLFFNES